MRVGLISADFAPNVGGVAAHVVELGKSLARAGHEVHVFTLPLGDERDACTSWHGMTVHRPPFPKNKLFYTILMRRFLKNFMSKQKLDVLHVHGMRPLEATRGLDVPVLFTNHTSGFLKRLEKGPKHIRRAGSQLKHIAHVLAPSQQLVDATREVGYDKEVDFIPNGVDTNRFTPGHSNERLAWGVKEDETVILLGRRLVEKNGVVVFADAVTKINTPKTKFVFAGDGPERNKVESILKKGNRFEQSIFLGNVPNTKMPDLYRAADISVLPSFMEATSITGLESMSTGLPLVGTRVGGIPTLIDEGKTGLLVEPGNPTALAESITQLIEDKSLRKSMGDAARQRAIQKFSWDHIAAATTLVYAEVSGSESSSVSKAA